MQTKTEINHWCRICGKGYHACDDCDLKNFITWRAIACTPEHFQAYTILHEYDGSEESKEKAKDMLKSLSDVQAIGDYPETTRRLLNEIFAEKKAADKTNVKQKQKNTVKTKQSVEPKNE